MRSDETQSPALPGGRRTAARASVEAGAIRTAYLRLGSGAPLVVLDAAVDAARAREDLLFGLAAHFSVVAPELHGPCAPPDAPPGTAFSVWLRGFMDGMGIAQASIVAREAFAAHALSFCLTDPSRVERLVLCYRDGSDPAVCVAAAPEVLARTGHPLLVHREPRDDSPFGIRGSATADIVRFLRGDVAPP